MCLWGEKFLPEPCSDQFTSQSKGLYYGLGARKTGLDLHQSKKTTPQRRIQLVALLAQPWRSLLLAGSTLTFRDTRQPHARLPAALPRSWRQRDPCAPALPLPACPLTCVLPLPARTGIREQAFPGANPSLTAGRLRDLGQVIPPSRALPQHTSSPFLCP